MRRLESWKEIAAHLGRQLPRLLGIWRCDAARPEVVIDAISRLVAEAHASSQRR